MKNIYFCKFCGNDLNFIEHNFVATEVIQENGELSQVREEFLECVEVVCGKCNSQIMEEGEYID